MTRTSHRPACSPRTLMALAALLTCVAVAPPADAVCVGDCTDDGRVSIADLQACVNLASGLPAPACAAADQNSDGTVDDNEVDACIQSFLDAATCPMVFTPAPAATATATPPATATTTIPPTNTVPPLPTATPTAPFTPTPTPTEGIVARECQLAPNPGSQIQIHIAALPVPLSFGLNGSLSLGTTRADAGGRSAATCDVVSIGAINIPSIGFVCIDPAPGCPIGTRDCNGGTALGIDVTSDGNAGSCTSAAACAAICNTTCGGEANVLTAGCTGFCAAGDERACTNDQECADAEAGACNGPDPVQTAQRNLCQCSCLDLAAHGASEAGDFRCNLGSNLNVETAAPCDGTDVRIEVGQTCIPVSTQQATSQITDANFAAGSMVPPPPNANNLTGATVSCAALDGGTVTGITGVGAVNFFGSALGDLAVGLKASCE